MREYAPTSPVDSAVVAVDIRPAREGVRELVVGRGPSWKKLNVLGRGGNGGL